MKKQKVFQVIYKFADVIDCICAESEEEAREIANQILNKNKAPQIATYCYEIETEEILKDGDE